ncbi:hypothetical protein B0J13DRAFT_591364 [Dactylonectria estremocensis]|uniref:Transcription factor domain-containing protein n=1 Tax=Dactylonectria estremocensis TaxID=1079267 RepID=A0A9P9JD03_9HYPO|nr:hypothetical protein B0J13DRAFT_591364 [Dactylonectria estremocensis]
MPMLSTSHVLRQQHSRDPPPTRYQRSSLSFEPYQRDVSKLHSMPASMVSPPKAGKEFIFVTANVHGQPAAGDRKLIRSHVMRGKNTRTRAHPNRLTGHVPVTTVEGQQPQPAVGLSNSSEESHGVRTLRELNSDVDALVRVRHQATVPRAANVFTFIKFAEDIDSSSRNLLCTYFSYLKDAMYPIGRYSRFDATNAYWFHWAQLDLAYLHSILYTTSFFYDSLAGQKSRRTEFYLYRTIHELNKQLANPTTALTDSTTTVVMGMALIAECFGDVESAHMHVVGLKRIVSLRGGIESFANRPQLQAKLYRTGLVYSICTGAKPAFHQDAASFESAFESSPELARLKLSDASCFSRSRSVVRALERRLYGVFKDVQDLSQLINDAHNSTQKIREMPLEDLMTSMQSRLLMLEFNDGNILPELLRLSLLAFLTTVFWSFPGVKFEYPHLANQLRQACLAFKPTTAGESYLFAWALMVGAASLFHHPHQTWLPRKLRPLIRDNLGGTWFEVQNNLRRVMWIDSIHDGPGIEVFNQRLGETGDGSIKAQSNPLSCG